MNSDDCILELLIIYQEQSFSIKSDKVISIDKIKEEAINYFKIKSIDKNNLKLFIRKEEKNIFISSVNDIILNTDDTDINNPKLNLNLLLESKEESINKENRIIKTNIQEKDNKDKNENKDKDKYQEIKNMLEKLSKEIIILKEEQSNKYKKIEENNLNMEKEITEFKKEIDLIIQNKIIEEDEKIKQLLKEECNKLDEKINKVINKLGDLFKQKRIESNNIQNIIKETFEKFFEEKNKTISSQIQQLEETINNKLLVIGRNIDNIIELKTQELTLKSYNHDREIEYLKNNNKNLEEFNLLLKNQLTELINNEQNLYKINNNLLPIIKTKENNSDNNFYNINEINYNFNIKNKDNNNDNQFSSLEDNQRKDLEDKNCNINSIDYINDKVK